MSLLNTPKYKDLKIREFKVHQPPTKPNLATWLGRKNKLFFLIRFFLISEVVCLLQQIETIK